jgi:type IX secretion system PorP/SprF family membrane protein
MKKLTLFVTILAVCGSLFGQQEPQNTLYMLNPFLTNPALAGTNNYYQIRTNHRFQWTGLKDAPITNSISAYGPHSTKSMGYGGTIYNDITGPTSRTGLNAVYAYNIAVNTDIRVSMGLSLGIMQYKVDGTKIELHDAEPDNALQKTLYSKVVPDGSMGIYVWNSDFFAGFSALQLLNNKIKLSAEDPEPELNRLARHYYLFGGYHYEPSKDLALEPTLVIKKVVPAAYQFEFNAKVIYQRMLWGGISFRTQDAVSLVLGYTYENKYFVGCGYDYAVSSLRKYTTGSFEFCLGVNFSSLKKASGRKKK